MSNLKIYILALNTLQMVDQPWKTINIAINLHTIFPFDFQSAKLCLSFHILICISQLFRRDLELYFAPLVFFAIPIFIQITCPFTFIFQYIFFLYITK